MIIRQFFIPGIAHYSYLLGGVSSCFIIDPARDPKMYLQAAKEEGFHITGILETHLHADFISGHLDLHHATNAPIYAPQAANCSFDHIPVHEGSEITLDDCSVRVMETPGHTPEHISYVITHVSRGEDPVALFPGDTLFVGDVGRPDLFPGRAHELASALYHSIHDKLLSLPDYCEVYPTHGAGSFCGKALSSKRTTTIGYERKNNQILQIKDKETFIQELTGHMPPAPDHFFRCSETNRKGPALISTLSKPLVLDHREMKRYLTSGATLLDTRRYDAFGSAHIPKSLNIDGEANFSPFSGWILSPDQNIILMVHHQDDIPHIIHMLQAVGLDNTIGYGEGGIQTWAMKGGALDHIPVLSVYELSHEMKEHPSLQILDVRTNEEYEGFHIPGSVNIHWPDIRTEFQKIKKTDPVAVLCTTGIRAGIACSMLKNLGYSQVYNVAGGYTGWIAAGLLENE